MLETENRRRYPHVAKSSFGRQRNALSADLARESPLHYSSSVQGRRTQLDRVPGLMLLSSMTRCFKPASW